MKNRKQTDPRPRHPSADGGLSEDILKWVEASGASAQLPAQGPLLGFRDPLLERAYLRDELRRNRKYYVVSVSIVTLLVASFLWTDPWLLPPDALPVFRMARVYLLVPLCMLLAVNAVWIADPIRWIWQCAALLALFGLVHPVLILINGIGVFGYLELGILEVILGTFLLFGLPVRWSVSIVILFGVIFGACVLRVETNATPLVNFCVDFVAYTCLGVVASYRYEDTSRREFIAQALSRKEYSERLAADADRRRWLEVIAEFLRHELKNAMTAISTSIELAARVTPHSDAAKYLDRGRRSVQYMQQLLTKVAEATNLESALAQHELESLDLSGLILDRVDDFRKDTPGRAFATQVESGICVKGHGDSLVQMLDKLLNNALEHGDPTQPIRIELRDLSGSCAVTISDTGDPLPQDNSQIFEPFVTNKRTPAGAGSLGLGLFVARAIAINHGGDIYAEPLSDAVGASFIVQLPSIQSTVSQGDPSVAAPALGSNPVEGRVNL